MISSIDVPWMPRRKKHLQVAARIWSRRAWRCSSEIFGNFFPLDKSIINERTFFLYRRLEMKADVLIAGAGPVGLTTAIELARFGVPVRIIDKSPERTDKSKALVVWSRTLELLERAGCSA